MKTQIFHKMKYYLKEICIVYPLDFLLGIKGTPWQKRFYNRETNSAAFCVPNTVMSIRRDGGGGPLLSKN